MRTSITDRDDRNLLRDNSSLHTAVEWSEIFNGRYAPQLIEKFCKARKWLLKDSDGLLRRRYDLKEDFFSMWSEGMAYTLGFLFATGTLSDNRIEMRCDTKIRESMDLIARAMGYQDDLIVGGNVNMCSMTIVNKRLYKDLSVIVNGNITLRHFPPSIPFPFIRHFVRGFFDGNADVEGGEISFCGYNDFFLELWDILNIYACIEGGVYDGIGRRLRFDAQDSQRIAKFMYHKNPKFLLQRKFRLLEGS